MKSAPASLRRNSAWMFGSRTLRALVAALYFTLLARSLGVTGYGAFTGACAMASILAPFASFGSGNILIRDVARDRDSFPARWANCLLITTTSGSILTGIAVLLSRLLLPRSVPMLVILAIGIADLLFVRVLDVSGQAFQAIEQLRMMAWFSFALTFSRMIAAAILLGFVRQATPATWSLFYLVSSAIPAGFALWAVTRHIGRPAWHFACRATDILQGIFFSISLSSQTIYNDIDKTMLARLSGLGAAGLYGAAYRIVDAAFSPVNAVMAAAYARFFQHGEKGIQSAARFGGRLALRSVSYSAVAAAALWFIAPMVPAVIGRQFADCVIALRFLTPILLLRSLHCFAADSLTGAGYQGTRTLLQVSVALLNIGLNMLILPRYSWRGAVWTSLACDGALVVLLWASVAVVCARERRLPCTVAIQDEATVRA